MKNHFKDTVIIIIGGASGIGKSLSNQLAGNAKAIFIVDRNTEAGSKQVNGLRSKSQVSEFIYAEMVNAPEVKKVFETIAKKYGQIDYVFNCAGIFMAGEIRDTPIENWQKVIENNVWAVNNGTHYAYQAMLPFKKGHIINIASAAGLFPVPIMGIYGASKYAIVGLSHELRNEAKVYGIKVSVVCPTIVNTPLYDTAIYNNVNKEKALKARETLQTADTAAKKIIKGVIKNKATIHTSFSTKVGWWTYKNIPPLYNVLARRIINTYRKSLRKKSK